MKDYNNPFDLLTDDHEEVKALFGKLEEASSSAEKKSIWKKISHLLSVHTANEEQYFYPKLEGFKELHEMMGEAVEEHNQVEAEMMKLEDTNIKDEEWMSIVTVIKEDLLHHIKEEEGEVFPLGRKMLIEEEQKLIAKQMMETKKEEA